MSRSRRLLTVLACAAGACAPSAPAALASAGGQGVVLALAGHTVRVVDRGHRVGDVHVNTTRGLRRGDVVRVRNGRARVTGHLGKVAFLGRVVRSSGSGAVMRLGDGSTFKVGGGRPHGRRAARSAADVTVNFDGLAPGQTLLVTIATDAQGNVAITIRVISSGTDIGDGELQASGVVTDDTGDGAFGISTADGSGLSFSDPQRLFEAAAAGWCDTVDVGYRKDGHRLVADTLKVTGQSEVGDCADPGAGAADEVDGTVTAIADDASALTVAPDDGSAAQTIPVDDPSLLDGVEVGDDVAVTLDDAGAAIDVELLGLVDDSGDGGDS